jgi:hypothetical protein
MGRAWLSHSGKGMMKLLLIDSGIKNASIHDALVGLLRKPIAESGALFIPTALYAQPGGTVQAARVISGREDRAPMTLLGWKTLGVLELTAQPSIGGELRVPMVKEADALLVEGGDPTYLCHWICEIQTRIRNRRGQCGISRSRCDRVNTVLVDCATAQ